MSRCSTLQSAHRPVRGQPALFGALSESLPGAGVLMTLMAAVPEEEAESALPDDEREHATKVGKPSRRREVSLVIELER